MTWRIFKREEGIQYVHLCEVTQVVPGKKITYSWRYDGYAGISYVTFDLSEKNDQTFLKLTHEGIETFPKENPDFDASNFEEGWNQIIHQNLKKFFEDEKLKK
ncbi:MAG: SRPBCC domain-containing protein [Ferruginibacter sp.]